VRGEEDAPRGCDHPRPHREESALHVLSNVVEASGEKPYLNIRIDLAPASVASVMIESGIELKKSSAKITAMDKIWMLTMLVSALACGTHAPLVNFR
jgi:hypothetical protein